MAGGLARAHFQRQHSSGRRPLRDGGEEGAIERVPVWLDTRFKWRNMGSVRQVREASVLTYYSLLATHYLLLTTHYSLLTTHYMLLASYCLLAHARTAYSRTRTRLTSTYYLLPTAYCLLPAYCYL